MSINCLAINVGNTRIHLGTFVDGELVTDRAIGSDLSDLAQAVEAAHAPLIEKPDRCVLLASVNDLTANRLVKRVEKTLGVSVHRVEKDVPVPIGRRLDPEAIVGEDRLLNAAAAYDVLKQSCAIVDAGTAVTVDFVDGEGTFHGGAILPGARAMLASLNRYTAQLPDVDLEKPTEAIGHNTIQAIRSGVYHGLRGAIRELVEQFAESAGMYPTVVATGGDAEFLFEGDEFIERIVPDLTLRGIGLALQTSLGAGA